MSTHRSFTNEEYQAMYYHEESIFDYAKALLRAHTHDSKAKAIYGIQAATMSFMSIYNKALREKGEKDETN